MTEGLTTPTAPNDTKPAPVELDPPTPGVEVKSELSGAAKNLVPKFNTDKMDVRTYLVHLSSWNDVSLSARYLAATLVIFYYTGPLRYSFLGFLSLVLLARTLVVHGVSFAANTLNASTVSPANFIGKQLQKVSDVARKYSEIPQRKSVTFWIEGVSTYVETRVATACQKLREAETDARIAKVVVAHLVAFFLIFAIFSLRTLAFGSAFSWLTLPGIYAKHNDKIDPIVDQLKAKAKPYVEKATAKGREIAEQVAGKVAEIQGKVKEKVGNVQVPGMKKEQ